ncbi:DedA family protein [Saccharibacter sp. 17.LH.SD]|uniref:DedA family protein n=1 Tax=Saccharibacter sp. 17.LH.SD TaxID=2689393 RepID=UPI00136D17ED|nr:DedA family protein [Saccharibacter sp. 17.LH.SD]MXV45161.1 DedA family protein [Saccharibacter sp. 17.LH.SD]
MFESTGVPLPAESLLILTSLYAAKTHHLSLEGVMASAIIGAILGDNLGYEIGRRFGYGLLEKHGSKIGLNSDRLLLGRYLFRHYGGLGVLMGRFMAILRIFIALLAGAVRMPWLQFFFYNALGGTLWGGSYVFITYKLGEQIEDFSGPVGISVGVVAVLGMVGGFLFLRHHEHALLEKAKLDEEQYLARQKKKRTP